MIELEPLTSKLKYLAVKALAGTCHMTLAPRSVGKCSPTPCQEGQETNIPGD